VPSTDWITSPTSRGELAAALPGTNCTSQRYWGRGERPDDKGGAQGQTFLLGGTDRLPGLCFINWPRMCAFMNSDLCNNVLPCQQLTHFHADAYGGVRIRGHAFVPEYRGKLAEAVTVTFVVKLSNFV
jgi:hypothetical protein